MPARIIFLSLILAFPLLAISCSKEKNKNAPQNNSPSIYKKEEKQKPQAVIENFYRSNFSGNSLKWEISGSKAYIFKNGEKITIYNSILTFYKKKEGKIKIAAPTAKIFLEKGTPSEIKAKGGVKLLYNQELAIETPSAVYLFKKGIVKGKDKVEIHHPTAFIKGKGFKANLKTLTVTMLNNVYSIIRVK